MSSRLFTIIGDANVRRNMTGLNIASRESMKSAQVLDCISFSELDVSLNDVRAESNVLILAAVTEFILASGDCGTILSSIDPILSAFAAKMISFCTFRPMLQACLGFFVLALRKTYYMSLYHLHYG